MGFPQNAYLATLIAAFVATCLSLPFWAAACRKRGWIDHPSGRKAHNQPTPLAGGLAILTGLTLPLIAAILLILCQPTIWNDGIAELRHGLNRRGSELGALMLGALGMALIGWLDDRRPMNPLPKFIGQCFIAIIVALAGIRITLFVENPIFTHTITVLWIVGVTNAFNFSDNMNGLCAGLGAIASGALAAIAIGNGQYLVASLSLLITGALLGFLPHNYPSARAFLGDSGSHLTGFLLAVLAILPDFHSPIHPLRWAVLLPLLILLVPLLDMAFVVLHRLRHGQPFHQGDRNHFSHQLVDRGLKPSNAVALLWGIALIAALAAVLLLHET